MSDGSEERFAHLVRAAVECNRAWKELQKEQEPAPNTESLGHLYRDLKACYQSLLLLAHPARVHLQVDPDAPNQEYSVRVSPPLDVEIDGGWERRSNAEHMPQHVAARWLSPARLRHDHSAR